jgi:hypothetical protein
MNHPETESMGLHDPPEASSMRLCKRKKKLQQKKKTAMARGSSWSNPRKRKSKIGNRLSR